MINLFDRLKRAKHRSAFTDLGAAIATGATVSGHSSSPGDAALTVKSDNNTVVLPDVLVPYESTIAGNIFITHRLFQGSRKIIPIYVSKV